MSDRVTFTRAGLFRGAIKILPLVVGDVPFAIVLGVLARQAGMSTLEVVLMSMLVFAGASQLIAVGLWATPVPAFTIVLTTLIVNLRHLLMGASLRPWFSRLGPLKTYTSAHFITDESWAITIREFKNGGRDAAFLMGSGLMLFVLWVSGTAVGHLLGAGISAQDLVTWGIDFIVTAVFVALTVSLWRGKSDLLPWLIAAGVSLGAYLLLPGTRWYIVLGGLAGSIVGAFRDAD
jgi:4-azaleucine resistance transporter AzlC